MNMISKGFSLSSSFVSIAITNRTNKIKKLIHRNESSL